MSVPSSGTYWVRQISPYGWQRLRDVGFVLHSTCGCHFYVQVGNRGWQLVDVSRYSALAISKVWMQSRTQLEEEKEKQLVLLQ